MVRSTLAELFFLLERVFSDLRGVLAASIRVPRISVPSVSACSGPYVCLFLLTYVGASGDTSHTPRWVFDLVRRFQLDSMLLKERHSSRHGAARTPARKNKAAGTGKDQAIATATVADAGKDKAGGVPAVPVKGLR